MDLAKLVEQFKQEQAEEASNYTEDLMHQFLDNL
jgi:hypothetical protein